MRLTVHGVIWVCISGKDLVEGFTHKRHLNAGSNGLRLMQPKPVGFGLRSKNPITESQTTLFPQVRLERSLTQAI